MTGRLEGKVAFITGAARGQGRAHAVRTAQEGGDVIAVDVARPATRGGALRVFTPSDERGWVNGPDRRE